MVQQWDTRLNMNKLDQKWISIEHTFFFSTLSEREIYAKHSFSKNHYFVARDYFWIPLISFFFSVCKVKPKTFSIPLLNSVPLYLILDSVLCFGVFSEFPSFHDFHSSSRGEQTITKLHSQSFS